MVASTSQKGSRAPTSMTVSNPSLLLAMLTVTPAPAICGCSLEAIPRTLSWTELKMSSHGSN